MPDSKRRAGACPRATERTSETTVVKRALPLAMLREVKKLLKRATGSVFVSRQCSEEVAGLGVVAEGAAPRRPEELSAALHQVEATFRIRRPGVVCVQRLKTCLFARMPSRDGGEQGRANAASARGARWWPAPRRAICSHRTTRCACGGLRVETESSDVHVVIVSQWQWGGAGGRAGLRAGGCW